MMTAFWFLFALAVLVIAAVIFAYLLIPIIVIGCLILAFNACGGSSSHGRSVGQTTHSVSVESARMPSGHHGQT